MNGKFQGCAVGCAVQSLNVKRGLSLSHNDHFALAEASGIPEWLYRIQDTIFEGLPKGEGGKFSIEFFEAINPGVNLEPVKWKFYAFILKENIERVLLLNIDDKLKQEVVEAIHDVLSLHEKAIKNGEWAARSAASAAYQKYAKELLRLLVTSD